MLNFGETMLKRHIFAERPGWGLAIELQRILTRVQQPIPGFIRLISPFMTA